MCREWPTVTLFLRDTNQILKKLYHVWRVRKNPNLLDLFFVFPLMITFFPRFAKILNKFDISVIDIEWVSIKSVAIGCGKR